MNLFNENDLVRRLGKDDVQAFDILYQKYHRALFANINRLVKDHNASEDILQEVFISLWEKRTTLDPADHVAGWLFVVSYNKSVNHLKKSLRQEVYPLENNLEVIAAEPELDLIEIQVKLLDEAISGLSPQKRKVFELCKIHGKTYEETALELHISKHTVKEYLVLAVQNIKTYIRQHPEYRSSLCFSALFLSLWFLVSSF